METRYILPAIVAASLHLVALLGFNHPHHPSPGLPDDPAKVPPIVICTFEDPPEPIDEPERVTAIPKGSPDARRPQNDEPLPVVSDITRPLPAVLPQPAEVTTKIVPGEWGAIDGKEGVWTNRPVVDYGALDNPPRTRSQIAPSYPPDLKASGVTGEVLVAFVVEESGHVSNVHIVRSADARFEAATLRAIERWRFEPGKNGGRPVRFRMEAPVVFSLSES